MNLSNMRSFPETCMGPGKFMYIENNFAQIQLRISSRYGTFFNYGTLSFRTT